MSHKASAWAMEQVTKTPLAKLILLILSDCHNAETGACYPSFSFIAKRAGCSARSVVYSIESLEKDGLIGIEKTYGKSNNYAINPCNICTSATTAHVQITAEPVQSTTRPVQSTTKTSATIAHKSGKNREVNREVNREYKPAQKVTRPDSVSEQIWNDFQTLRKTLKAPITETAINGIDREAGKAGLSLNAALQICVERSWRSFKAEWLQNGLGIPQPGNGKYTARTIQNAHNLRGWADE